MLTQVFPYCTLLKGKGQRSRTFGSRRMFALRLHHPSPSILPWVHGKHFLLHVLNSFFTGFFFNSDVKLNLCLTHSHRSCLCLQGLPRTHVCVPVHKVTPVLGTRDEDKSRPLVCRQQWPAVLLCVSARCLWAASQRI